MLQRNDGFKFSKVYFDPRHIELWKETVVWESELERTKWRDRSQNVKAAPFRVGGKLGGTRSSKN